ncbi:hypothetical protein [Flavobacterium sp. ZB4R12]|uniref:hypothetical protein n=1 Tax=Flavobacterium sp. ZB4R12 TaxID=3398732 RepID=UPI003AAC3267
MKTETTLLLPAFFTIVGNKYFSFDAPKSWTGLVQTTLLQSKKIMPFDLLINFLKKNSGSIDFIILNVENLAKAIRPSTPTTTLRCEFCYLQSSYFLTI